MFSILFLLGLGMVVVSIKLYLMFVALEKEIGILSYDHIVRENDLHFLQCPQCSDVYDFIELSDLYYNFLSTEEIDRYLATVGMLCPTCQGIAGLEHKLYQRFQEEQKHLREWLADSPY